MINNDDELMPGTIPYRFNRLLQELEKRFKLPETHAFSARGTESFLTELLIEDALLRQKIITYEKLLHMIQLHVAVTMNASAVHKLIENICDWSYAHRIGNGELSEEEQDQRIKRAFDKLLDTGL